MSAKQGKRGGTTIRQYVYVYVAEWVCALDGEQFSTVDVVEWHGFDATTYKSIRSRVSWTWSKSKDIYTLIRLLS